jgi:AbrB family looped-hinge helix DNA binding protein
MNALKVSSGFQIVIPKAVRESAGIKPGDKFQALCIDGLIHLIRVRPMREMRGFLRGLDSSFAREMDDRI